MKNPPSQAILSDAFKEALNGRKLVTALFTTYCFDSGFFERQILPVFLDAEMATDSRRIQLARLEDALREVEPRPQVFYHAGQVSTGQDSISLNVGRHPIRMTTGAAFHPKLVCLLVEDPAAGEGGRELLVACLSANLTRSGWWENLECGHIEPIRADTSSHLREPLLQFIRWLGNNGLATSAEEVRAAARNRFGDTALGMILRFLEDGTAAAPKLPRKSNAGEFEPRFHFSARSVGQGLVDFLKGARDAPLEGMYLEILSPYFDDAPSSKALQHLVDTFSPREVRVHMPKDETGAVRINRHLYEEHGRSRRFTWGQLPAELTRNGKGAEAKQRFVHAKVYRFFSKIPKREFWYVGSANLTNAGHQQGGNMECGFLVEKHPPGRTGLDFWMEPLGVQKKFAEPLQETEGSNADSDLTRLQLRYDWRDKKAEVLWDDGQGKVPFPGGVTLRASDIPLGSVPVPPRDGWLQLPAAMARQIESHLESTSLFMVCHGDHSAMILAQENGMSHKPGLLQQMTVAEILRYWSLLTPRQREEFLEREVLPRLEEEGPASASSRKLAESNYFDQVAGFFHAFQQLEQSVDEALAKGRRQFAVARLFGRKHDSLGRVLRHAAEQVEKAVLDPVDWYLLALCARQSLEEIRRRHEDFWEEEGKEAKVMMADVRKMAASARERISDHDDAELPAYLGWFEEEFLRRQPGVTKEVAS